MTAVVRVFLKELLELLLNFRLLALSFLVPPLVILLVGQLNTQGTRVRVVMTGLAECSKVQEGAPVESRAARLYNQLSEVSKAPLSCETEKEADTFERMSRHDVDLLINVDSDDGETWSMYVAETNPRHLAAYLELAAGIRVADALTGRKGVNGLYKYNALGILPLQGAQAYYPRAADRTSSMLPGTFSLIVCLLAFVVAAPSLSREREERTLEVLLSAPNMHGGSVLLGKILFSVAVSLVAAILMLVVAGIAYDFVAKANTFAFLLALILPILSSSLLGLTVSSLASTQSQTVMASAAYFFFLLLLSGFLYPLDASSTVVRVAANLFSLTFFLDTANAWFFGAEAIGLLPLPQLVAQVAVYAGLLWLAWRRLSRRI